VSVFFILKVNGQTLAKEFCDQDIINIWETGLIKNPKEITGFSQYKLPSGVIRLVYTLEKKIDLGNLSLTLFLNLCPLPHFLLL
jgi:hypothetical protein